MPLFPAFGRQKRRRCLKVKTKERKERQENEKGTKERTKMGIIVPIASNELSSIASVCCWKIPNFHKHKAGVGQGKL